jgi:hypothetical protein
MSVSNTVVVNGHSVPQKIISLIQRNQWTFPREATSLQQLFTDELLSNATLYTLDVMRSKNENALTSPSEKLRQSIGLDLKSSILIGDLGPDMFLSLDYRTSANDPRVVYLPSNAQAWVQIAPDVDSFLDALTLNHTVTEISPRVLHISWGSMEIENIGKGKDFKLWPGGGRDWDWSETGTRHKPGIQPADLHDMLDHGCDVVVLSRGVDLRLHTMPETLDYLKERKIEVHVEQTYKAVELYNKLAETRRVGGLFHSTC